MKAFMWVWVEKPDNLPAWFENNKVIDINESQIVELFNSGANVMMLHPNQELEDDAKLILAVDTKRFQQR